MPAFKFGIQDHLAVLGWSTLLVPIGTLLNTDDLNMP